MKPTLDWRFAYVALERYDREKVTANPERAFSTAISEPRQGLPCLLRSNIES